MSFYINWKYTITYNLFFFDKFQVSCRYPTMLVTNKSDLEIRSKTRNGFGILWRLDTTFTCWDFPFKGHTTRGFSFGQAICLALHFRPMYYSDTFVRTLSIHVCQPRRWLLQWRLIEISICELFSRFTWKRFHIKERLDKQFCTQFTSIGINLNSWQMTRSWLR